MLFRHDGNYDVALIAAAFLTFQEVGGSIESSSLLQRD